MDAVRIETTERARATRTTTRLFGMLVLAHLVIWTAAPLIAQPNATLDTVEMVLWGHEWQWGYYKHPPLPAWISEASVAMFGPVTWPLHLGSQLLVVVCFWSVWRLAKQFLEPWPALASVMMLEACTYYHFSSIDLNNNLPAKACWALAILSFYGCVTQNRKRDWIALGAAVGLSLLSKYDIALLAMSMIAFTAIQPQTRRVWRTPGPYLALALATLIFMPHLIWLVQHDFLTIKYLRERSASESSLLHHLSHPVEFLLMQLLAVSAMLLLSVPLLGWRWKLRSLSGEQYFQRSFLLAVVVGPLIIVTIASALTGARLRSAWGSPMFTYLGLLLLVLFQSVGTERVYRRVSLASSVVGAAFALLFVVIGISGPFVRGRAARIHFPGQALADEVERRWQSVSSEPLEIIAGDWWEAGNVALYSRARPSVFINLTSHYSPWTSDDDLATRGGAIVWDASSLSGNGSRASDDVLKRFPNLILGDPIVLNWNSSAAVKPLVVGIGIVPGDDASVAMRSGLIPHVARPTAEEVH